MGVMVIKLALFKALIAQYKKPKKAQTRALQSSLQRINVSRSALYNIIC